MARKRYYDKRVEFFETINRHTMQDTLVATVMRQKYYEAKKKFMENEIIQKEAERFAYYETAASEYLADLAAEKRSEEEERQFSSMEDDFAEALYEAKIMSEFQEIKQEHFDMAKSYYELGIQQMVKVHKKEEEINAKEGKWEQNEEYMLKQHERKIKALLQSCGISTNFQGSQVRPQLPPWPTDMDDVSAVRAYHFGPMWPVEDLDLDDGEDPYKELEEEEEMRDRLEAQERQLKAMDDQKERQDRQQVAAQKAAAKAASPQPPPPEGSLDLWINQNPADMSLEQKKEFVTRIAEMMNVDPNAVVMQSMGQQPAY